jgi:hypothetical protein
VKISLSRHFQRGAPFNASGKPATISSAPQGTMPMPTSFDTRISSPPMQPA